MRRLITILHRNTVYPILGVDLQVGIAGNIAISSCHEFASFCNNGRERVRGRVDCEHEHDHGHGNLSQIGPSCQAVSSLVEGWTMCWVPVYKRVQATQIQLLGGS